MLTWTHEDRTALTPRPATSAAGGIARAILPPAA
jgi:hypothetical protein